MIKNLLRHIPIRALSRSTIAGNTGIMTVGIGVQILLQAVAFILVTRTMGARSYGAFISVAALANIVGAFAGWGGDQLLIRTVANTRDQYASAFGSALIYLAVSAPVLVVLAVIAIPHLIADELPWLLVLLVVLSDVLFFRLNIFAINCFQAFERGRDMAWLGIALYAARASGAVVWSMTTVSGSPLSWAWFYLASSVIAGIVSMIHVVRRLGWPIWRARWQDWREGGGFALQIGSFIGFRDIDKPAVVALSSLGQAGLYGAAFRIADVAAVPVRALMYSTYVRFFQRGTAGTRGSLAFAVSLLPVGLVLGGLAGVALALSATFATAILGANYAGIGHVLLILSPMPALYALYYIGADALVSGGHIGYRTAIQLLLPILDIGLCVALVPHYGAVGAGAAAVCTHIVLVLVTWVSAFLVAREEALVGPN